MNKALLLYAIGVGVLVPIFPFLSAFLQGLLIVVLLAAFWATTWNLLGGLAGQVGFGHALFVGIGAYTSSVLYIQSQISPWLGMWLGAALSVIAAWFIGFLCFRYGLRDVFFSLVTLAFSIVAFVVVLNTDFAGPFRGSRGIAFPVEEADILRFQFANRIGYFIVIALFLAAVLFITDWIRGSKPGRLLAATREDELAAQAVGINTMQVKLIAFGLSAGLTALGGTFYAQYYSFIDPTSVFGTNLSVQIILPAIVGGMGTTYGPLLGSFVVIPLAEVARTLLGDTGNSGHQIVYGLVMLLVVLYVPGGLTGLFGRLRTRLSRRIREGGRELAAGSPVRGAEADSGGIRPKDPNVEVE